MKKINLLLIAGLVSAIEPIIILEDGTEFWNIPANIEEFRKIAIATIQWQIGDKVAESYGRRDVLASASNAKAIALLAKLMKPTKAQLDSLGEIEKRSFTKLQTLANSDYAESELLESSLDAVSRNISIGTAKIVKIGTAKTHDEIIEILNAAWK